MEGRFYLPQLDGLRFFAFLLVFLHHSPVFPGGGLVAASLKEYGFIGVDLFFVLSAYLLIALLQREHAATGTTNVRKFFIRRILRIWPLFYAYLAICFAYFVAFNGEDFGEVTGRTIGQLFLLDNFFTAFAGGSRALNFTPHLWTIAFEEQVYLFIPLLFMAILGLRNHPRLFAMAVMAVFVSQPVLRWGLTQFHDVELTVWVVPFFHFDTIAAGVLLGAGVGSGLKSRVSGDVLALAGLLVLGVIVLMLPGSDLATRLPQRTVYLFTLVALAFFLIVLGCLREGSWITWLLARQPLVFLGRISYGLYVWHWMGIYFAPGPARSWLSGRVNLDNPFLGWLSVVLPALSLTIALSVLSYFALERPFLRIKSRFTLVPNRRD